MKKENIDIQDIFNLGQQLDWSTQILRGLEYMHSLSFKIVHRDIKPDNLLVTEDGKVFIIDFNVSRMRREKNCLMMTKTGCIVFSAPEIF